MRRLRASRYLPALIGWAIIGGFAAVYDIWLIRTGRLPLTAAAQTPAGWAVRLYMEGHFARRLGAFDLFSRVGKWAARP